MDNRRIVQSAIHISFFTIISRILGYFREWVRGYLLGTTGSSDAFTMAFMFPNLLRRLVGEGALTAAFVPIFSDYLERSGREELDRFVKSFFTLLFFFLLFLVILALILAPILRYFLPEFAKIPKKIELTIFLTRLMFPYILLISLAALTQAILNSYKVFIPSAATPILLNVAIITLGLLMGTRMKEPGIALGIGVLLGGLLQFFFQIPFLNKRGISYGFHPDFRNPGVRKVFLLMIPGAIGAGVYQINALFSQFIAAFLEEGSVAALRFSNTLEELILGGFVISISTVILPALSEKSSRGDREGMMQNLRFALRLVFFITIPATFGLLILRYPIVRMLFQYGRFDEKSTDMVAYALFFHAFGLCGTGGARVTVQMFYSMKDTKTPVYIAFIAMAINLVLCYYLSKYLRLGGIALAGSISAFFNFYLLLIILKRRVGRIMDASALKSLLKSLSSSMVMGAVLYFALQTFGEVMESRRIYNAGITLSFLLFGSLLYFLINILLKNRDAIALIRMVRGKEGDI